MQSPLPGTNLRARPPMRAAPLRVSAGFPSHSGSFPSHGTARREPRGLGRSPQVSRWWRTERDAWTPFPARSLQGGGRRCWGEPPAAETWGPPLPAAAWRGRPAAAPLRAPGREPRHSLDLGARRSRPCTRSPGGCNLGSSENPERYKAESHQGQTGQFPNGTRPPATLGGPRTRVPAPGPSTANRGGGRRPGLRRVGLGGSLPLWHWPWWPSSASTPGAGRGGRRKPGALLSRG